MQQLLDSSKFSQVMRRAAKPKCDQSAAKSPAIHATKAKSSENILKQNILPVILILRFWIANPGDGRQHRSDPAWASYFNYILKSQSSSLVHFSIQPSNSCSGLTESRHCSPAHSRTPCIYLYVSKFLSHKLASCSNESYPLNLARKPRKRRLMPLERQ